MSRAIEWAIEGLSTEIGVETPGNLGAIACEVADFCVRALLIDGSKVNEIREACDASLGTTQDT